MPVKFIVVEDTPGSFRILFGSGLLHEYHDHIRRDNNIPENLVRGGGFAHRETKRIWGDSIKFGRFNPAIVQSLLPDWTLR